MSKPRILIVMHYLEIGGAESALIGLLQTLDPSRVDVDLFLYDHRGELMKFVPKWVNVLPVIPEYSMLERPIKELIKCGFLRLAWQRIKGKWKAKKNFNESGSLLENNAIFFFPIKETNKVLPSVNSQLAYDLAISFLAPHFVILDKVKAKKRVGWIHSDYTNFWIDAGEEWKMWSRLDKIISISPDVSRTFSEVFPKSKDKIKEIENILSPKFIRERSTLIDRSEILNELDPQGGITFLTIGRFCPQKKMEEIPYILKNLREIGHDIRWYIIGYGDETLILQSIEHSGMAEFVKILGKKENPYPYIAACDIYVQPSRYEGKSIVVREAQILGKPVIITDYPTAKSQVRDGIDGFIVPMPIEECAKSIAHIIEDGEKLNTVKEYNSSHDFGNEAEIEKIYKMLKE